MSASLKVHSTIARVVRQGHPREDLRRQRAFAWAVAGLILTGKVSLPGLALAVVTEAQALSTVRRLVRFLSNPRVNVGAYYRPFIQAALAGWNGSRVLVAIDTTSLDQRRVVIRVSLVYRGRAIPLAWRAVESGGHSVAFRVYAAVLAEAASLLPAGCDITLLGDRGFGTVALMAWCRQHGWHFALRLKQSRVIIQPDGRREHLADHRVAGGDIACLSAVRLPYVPPDALGPIDVHIARSPVDGAETWYIASDRSATLCVLADYSCRMDIEQSIRDDKSGAFGWEDTRLASALQVDRMLLVMAVATLYLVSKGTMVVEAGDRRAIDPHSTRGLSYLQIGLRAVTRDLLHRRAVRLRLRLDCRHDSDPVSPYAIPFKIFGSWTWLPGSSLPTGA